MNDFQDVEKVAKQYKERCNKLTENIGGYSSYLDKFSKLMNQRIMTVYHASLRTGDIANRSQMVKELEQNYRVACTQLEPAIKDFITNWNEIKKIIDSFLSDFSDKS